MSTQAEHRPGLVTRLAAALHGEVAATTVEAYRRAGSVAYQDMLDAEQVRGALAVSGNGLWSASPAQASQLLCAWNAFALQTLGDELVEADYRADPRTVGYLPPVTAEQAAAFLGEVEHWSARARRAASDAGYSVTAEVWLPVALPDWVKVEPCPPAHLAAMLAAARAMRGRAEAALADLVRTAPPEGKAAAAGRLQGMAAEADSITGFGEALWTPGATQEVHERVENSLRRGIAAYYRLGQLLAMPALLDQPEFTAVPPDWKPLPMPGQPGFDPWCLTDQRSLAHWQRDPAARRAIDSLWRYDPDPAATLAVQAQINAAVAAGAAIMESGRGPRYYFCCPWSAIYQVRRPVTIAGVQLRPMQEFTFDVSAEEMAEGGEFTRRLLTGPFHTTTKVDYCDPTSGHHDDDD
jgi:hypothetical protein